jgi:hypothetical protein
MNARRAATVVLMLAAGPAVPACLHSAAKTAADLPPLAVPAPPPRVVEVVEVQTPAPIPLVEEPQRQPIPPPPPRPTPRAEATRPEAKPEQTSPADAAKTEEPPKPPPTLQTTPAAAEGEVERKIRGIMARATSDLNRVNAQALNADARNQYDTAKSFLRQADAELKTTRNLVFAANLAEKAAALALQLAGR